MATPTVHIHCYLEMIEASLTPEQWFDIVGGYTDDKNRSWVEAGVRLDFQTNRTGGVLDFKNSLRDPGSVVIYLGHSALDFDNHYSMGLSPRGRLWYAEMTDMDRWDKGDWKRRKKDTGETPPKPEDLMSLLKTSSAKLVILASCGSATIPSGLTLWTFPALGWAAWKRKVAGGPAVIVTYSSLLTTLSFNWGHALAAFLLDLIDYEVDMSYKIVPRKLTYRRDHHGTIQQAVDAANVAFKNNKAPDIFVQVNGSGSTVVFPDRPLRSTTEDIAKDFVERVL